MPAFGKKLAWRKVLLRFWHFASPTCGPVAPLLPLRSTAEGLADTYVPDESAQSATATDPTIQAAPKGQFWRHKRLCYNASSCNSYSIVYL